MRFIAQYMKQLPVPPISEKMDNLLSNLTANILIDPKLPQVNQLEIEIDARVAHLYNLTEEEYTLILHKINATDPFRVGALNIFRDLSKGIIQ